MLTADTKNASLAVTLKIASLSGLIAGIGWNCFFLLSKTSRIRWASSWVRCGAVQTDARVLRRVAESALPRVMAPARPRATALGRLRLAALCCTLLLGAGMGPGAQADSHAAAAVACHVAHLPRPQPGALCQGDSERQIRVCAHSQQQADRFAASHYGNSTLSNITESGCQQKLASLCAQVDGRPVAATESACCGWPVAALDFDNCNSDSDCAFASVDNFYASVDNFYPDPDICEEAGNNKTCMPRVSDSVCNSWCYRQLRMLCPGSNEGLRTMYCNSIDTSWSDRCFGKEAPVMTTPPPKPVVGTPAPSSTPRPAAAPAPTGILTIILMGVSKSEFSCPSYDAVPTGCPPLPEDLKDVTPGCRPPPPGCYMQIHFLKVVASVAGVAETLLSLVLTRRRRLID